MKTPHLSGLDPAEAWRRLLEIEDPIAKAAAARRLLDSMPASERPLWLAKLVESFDGDDFDADDPSSRAALFGTLDTVLHQMMASDPAACLTAMQALDREHGRGKDLIPALMSSWARHDLNAARQFYVEHFAGKDDSRSDEIARSLVREMAKTDPKGALEWAAGLRDDRARERGLMTAFKAVLAADRNEAIALLATRTDLPEAHRLADQVAENWSRVAPARAFEWAQALPEGVREPASRTAFDALMKVDLDAARAAFDAAAPGLKSQLMPTMAQRASAEQIGAMADMLALEPPGNARAEASKALMRRWIEEDPGSASQWLTQQPAGEIQDWAILGLVSWADGNEPQSALDWAGTLTDPQLRSRYLAELMERYRESDRELARSWLSNTHRLTADERARFLEFTAQGP